MILTSPDSLRDSGASIAAWGEMGWDLKSAVYILIDWIYA